MAEVLFKSPLGYADANVHKISGVGIPGGDGSFQDASPIGSEYNDAQAGVKYMKIGAVNAPSDWVALSTATDSTGLQSQINSNASGLAAELTARQSAVASEQAARIAGDSGLQVEVDAIEAGAGLSVTGSYVADAAANYIAGSTSLHNATQLLDSSLAVAEANTAVNAAGIATLNASVASAGTTTGNASAAMQAELDAVEAGAGLSITGSYVVDAGTSYISGASTIHGATVLLDAQLLATSTLAAAAIPAVQKAAANGVATLDAAGKLLTAQLPAMAITTTSLVASQAAQLALTVQLGDVAVRTDLGKSFINNGGLTSSMSDWTELLTPTDPTMLSELNAVEAGAGLNAVGSYVPTVGANYISGATSLDNADQLLDTQLFITDGKSNVNAADITSLAAALTSETTNRQSAIAGTQTEIDAIEAGTGLSTTGGYVADATGSYISGAISVHNATQLLDSSIAAGAATAALLDAANTAEHTAMTTILGNGVYASSNNFLSSDDHTVAISKLDAKLTGTIATAGVAGTVNAVVDSVSTKVDSAVEWNMVVSDSATPSNRVAFKIFAAHDGDSATDATFFDWSEYSELELGAPIAGFAFAVSVNGAAAAQVMELSVTATNPIDVKVTRVTV